MNETTTDRCGENELKVDISESDLVVFRGLKVLVVDDSASMLHVLKDYLVRMGFGNVTSAKNGEEAWGLIQGQEKFDLVISDWKMPRLSGIELLDKVRNESETPTVPFVLVSSEAKTDSILMAGKHSATGYIVKPFCFAEFVGAIRQIFADKTSN
jgi:two-component system chemotaxis response regulator CheY